MASVTCSYYGRWYRQAKGLKIHVRSSQTSQPLCSCDQCGRSSNTADNLQTHMLNCTGRFVAVPTVAVPAVEKRCTVVAPEILQKTCEPFEGSVQQFAVNMKEAKTAFNIREGYICFQSVMMDFQQKRSAHKF